MENQEKLERNMLVIRLINKGLTYDKIGRIFGVTKARVENLNKTYNKDIYRNESVTCVNCGLVAGGNFDKKLFLFSNDPINICITCANFLKKINK